jgi:ABC-type antimicrobial peptide transport system permease subunit
MNPVGRLLLVFRLVIGDIKRRRVQSALLLAMIVTTTTTFALALALHGVTNSPFARSRAATKGPDVAATFATAPGSATGTYRPSGTGTYRRFVGLRRAPGVVAASGPYPLAPVQLTARGLSVLVEAEGRDHAPVAVDQPLLSEGSWVRPDGAVIERGLADALGAHVGDTIRLHGRPFTVVGIALSTGEPFYPASKPGVIWLTRADTAALATRSQPLSYALNLRLANPASAPAFANRYASDTAWFVQSWQDVRRKDGDVIALEQKVLLIFSWLMAMIAIASIAVLVGGRMAEQTRRVGLLKAVGATPSLVAVVLLAENLLLALAATIAGVAAGLLLAPLLTSAGNGLLGGPASPSLTLVSVALVACLAVAVAVAATMAPAIRGARTSTIRALSDPARPPQRRPWLIALSARFPVPLLLALRLVGRRPRRAVLAAASVAIAVAMVVATLALQHNVDLHNVQAGHPGLLPGASTAARVSHVVYMLSAILVVLAAINAIVTTWTTVIDAQRPTALARALGATPRQISAGLASAQLLGAVPAICLGIPAGFGLYDLAGGNGGTATPPILWLLAVIPGTLITVTALTALPARIGARRSVAEVLRAE